MNFLISNEKKRENEQCNLNSLTNNKPLTNLHLFEEWNLKMKLFISLD